MVFIFMTLDDLVATLPPGELDKDMDGKVLEAARIKLNNKPLPEHGAHVVTVCSVKIEAYTIETVGAEITASYSANCICTVYYLNAREVFRCKEITKVAGMFSQGGVGMVCAEVNHFIAPGCDKPTLAYDDDSGEYVDTVTGNRVRPGDLMITSVMNASANVGMMGCVGGFSYPLHTPTNTPPTLFQPVSPDM